MSKKKSIHNLSRKRSYVKIESYHNYNSIKDTNYNLTLKKIINKLKDKPFTLYIFSCRN